MINRTYETCIQGTMFCVEQDDETVILSVDGVPSGVQIDCDRNIDPEQPEHAFNDIRATLQVVSKALSVIKEIP